MTVAKAQAREEALKRALAELAEEFASAGVRGFEWRFGEDWAGDPAMFLWLVVHEPDWDRLSEDERLRIAKTVAHRLEEALDDERFVYVRVRDENDPPALEGLIQFP